MTRSRRHRTDNAKQINKQDAQMTIQFSPSRTATSPHDESPPRKASTAGILAIEPDSLYQYDNNETSSDIRTTLDLTVLDNSSTSTPTNLTKSVDFDLRPLPLTHDSIISFRKFLVSPECMSPHPPLFRNHVKNYTLLYFSQSKTRLIYLIRSNHVSYPMEDILTYKWSATVFSWPDEDDEYETHAEKAEYKLDGKLLVEVRGFFERERIRNRLIQWEELIAQILKKLRGVEKIAMEYRDMEQSIVAKRAKMNDGTLTIVEQKEVGQRLNDEHLRRTDPHAHEVLIQEREVPRGITMEGQNLSSKSATSEKSEVVKKEKVKPVSKFNFKENIFERNRPVLRPRRSQTGSSSEF